jgi:ubiquinone/menaquinone biosynthesis C-methylase UbiE
VLLPYEKAVAKAVTETHPKLIVDVGGGRSCAFSSERSSLRARTLALDISEGEIKENSDVDYRAVADVSNGLPLSESSADMITSHMAIEHMEHVDALFESSKIVLRPGGYCIHAFACKFAPYTVINQLLPQALSREIVYFLHPEQRGICGFPAVYNRCYYSAMRKLLLRHDFEIISMEPIFYQSPYFDFFLPLFLTSALYETLVAWLGVKDLCAYLLVVARKRP